MENEETPTDLMHATDNAQPYERVIRKQNKTDSQKLAERFVDRVGRSERQGNRVSNVQVVHTENTFLTQMVSVEPTHSGPVNEM